MRDRNAPLTAGDLDGLAWDKMDGLLPTVVQDRASGRILMLGYMNADTLRETLESGRMVFWSRSRQEVWRKGDTSGDRQYVREAYYDCDGDTLLVLVDQTGPACHTGTHSCFDGRVLTVD